MIENFIFPRFVILGINLILHPREFAFDFCVIRETCNDINVIPEPTTSAGNSFVVFIHLLSLKVI